MAYPIPNEFIEVYSRPCFVPAVYHFLSDTSHVDLTSDSIESKVGGTHPFFFPEEVDWPVCGECGKLMTFIIQLNLEKISKHPLYVEKTGGVGLFQLFVCLICEEQEISLDQNTYLARIVNIPLIEKSPLTHKTSSESSKSHTSLIKPPTKEDATILDECVLLDWDQCYELPHIYEIEESDEALRCLGLDRNDSRLDEICEHRLHPKPGTFKVFGWPYWIQGEDYPKCKFAQCGHPMHCLLQLAECGIISYMWGDCGIATVFQCPNHRNSFYFTWESS